MNFRERMFGENPYSDNMEGSLGAVSLKNAE